MLDFIKSFFVTDPKTGGKPRSSKWPKARAKWLSTHPTCAACGTKDKCEVHHVVPFSFDPSRELDETNFLTLCESDHQCHIRVGHSYNWECANPNSREDAALQLKRIKERLVNLNH